MKITVNTPSPSLPPSLTPDKMKDGLYDAVLNGSVSTFCTYLLLGDHAYVLGDRKALGFAIQSEMSRSVFKATYRSCPFVVSNRTITISNG